jgi:hypothetical protein
MISTSARFFSRMSRFFSFSTAISYATGVRKKHSKTYTGYPYIMARL